MSWATSNKTAAYQPYADVYGNGAQDRMQSNGAQYIPREQIDAVRQQQLDEFYRPADRRYRSDLSERNLQRHNSRPMRDQSAPGRYQNRRDEDSRRRRRDSYASSEASSSDGDGDGRGSYSRDPHRRDYFHRGRTQSEKRTRDEQARNYDGDVRSRVQKNFDASGNGVLAAAIGAGLGAITARRFDKNHYDAPSEQRDGRQRWKTVGGAVVGGLVANAAEERYRRWAASDKKEDDQG